MENTSKDIITIFQYLLPGFLAAWVFYGFTSYPKPSQFERVIQALIFTLITQTLVFGEKYILIYFGTYLSIGKWSNQSEIIFSTISALFIGLLFSYFANNDNFHKISRKIGITRETSYPSEWFGTFLKNITYVVLHFHDERRLYGWPIEWPSEAEKGHFVLEQASWLTDEVIEVNGKKEVKQIPLAGVQTILVNVNDVKWVEFMQKTWGKTDGEEKF